MTLLVILGVVFVLAVFLSRVAPAGGSGIVRNPNENEPDVYANDDADTDPESDTGEPNGYN